MQAAWSLSSTGQKMAKIRIGDLVHMYRRKTKGVGLVIESVEDFPEIFGCELDVIFETIAKLAEVQRGGFAYSSIYEFKQRMIEESTNSEAALAFFLYNDNVPTEGRIKEHFVRIKWFKQPSDYESTSMIRSDVWLPALWMKKIKN